MKRIVLLLTLTTIIFTVSCKKGQLNRANTSTEDNGLAESMFDDVRNMSESEALADDKSFRSFKEEGDTCATVTVVVLDSATQHRKITIDFGSSCVGQDGRTRSGKIIVEKKGKFFQDGGYISATTNNYTVDGYKVEGKRAVTNLGNSSGNWKWSINVTGGKITTPSGESITWESSRTREWTEGSATPFNIFDDVYSITGSASGTNREGRNYTLTITSALVKKIVCWWPVKGVLELEPEDLKKRTIDFGSGDCDSMVEVTVGNKTRNVDLRR